MFPGIDKFPPRMSHFIEWSQPLQTPLIALNFEL